MKCDFCELELDPKVTKIITNKEESTKICVHCLLVASKCLDRKTGSFQALEREAYKTSIKENKGSY